MPTAILRPTGSDFDLSELFEDESKISIARMIVQYLGPPEDVFHCSVRMIYMSSQGCQVIADGTESLMFGETMCNTEVYIPLYQSTLILTKDRGTTFRVFYYKYGQYFDYKEPEYDCAQMQLVVSYHFLTEYELIQEECNSRQFGDQYPLYYSPEAIRIDDFMSHSLYDSGEIVSVVDDLSDRLELSANDERVPLHLMYKKECDGAVIYVYRYPVFASKTKYTWHNEDDVARTSNLAFAVHPANGVYTLNLPIYV